MYVVVFIGEEIWLFQDMMSPNNRRSCVSCTEVSIMMVVIAELLFGGIMSWNNHISSPTYWTGCPIYMMVFAALSPAFPLSYFFLTVLLSQSQPLEMSMEHSEFVCSAPSGTTSPITVQTFQFEVLECSLFLRVTFPPFHRFPVQSWSECVSSFYWRNSDFYVYLS